MESTIRSPLTSEDVGRPDSGSEKTISDDEELCRKVQRYLDCRLQRIDPPADLTLAWNRFYDHYTPRIRSLLRRIGLPKADREDCLQDVWNRIVVCLRDLPYDPERGRLSSWLLAVARNRGRDVLRRRLRRHADALEDPEAIIDPVSSPAPACDEPILEEGVQQFFEEISGKVSPLSFQVFYLRLFEGRTTSEVAVALGLSPQRVRFRLHRVRRMAQALLIRASNPGHPGARRAALPRDKKNRAQ